MIKKIALSTAVAVSALAAVDPEAGKAAQPPVGAAHRPAAEEMQPADVAQAGIVGGKLTRRIGQGGLARPLQRVEGAWRDIGREQDED